MKLDEEALKVASAKLRKLRLTDSIAIKDTPPPAKTVKSVFKDALGGLYDDDAITYALRFGVRYYLEAVEQMRATDSGYVPPNFDAEVKELVAKTMSAHVGRKSTMHERSEKAIEHPCRNQVISHIQMGR